LNFFSHLRPFKKHIGHFLYFSVHQNDLSYPHEALPSVLISIVYNY